MRQRRAKLLGNLSSVNGALSGADNCDSDPVVELGRALTKDDRWWVWIVDQRVGITSSTERQYRYVRALVTFAFELGASLGTIRV